MTVRRMILLSTLQPTLATGDWMTRAEMAQAMGYKYLLSANDVDSLNDFADRGWIEKKLVPSGITHKYLYRLTQKGLDKLKTEQERRESNPDLLQLPVEFAL